VEMEKVVAIVDEEKKDHAKKVLIQKNYQNKKL